jgi:hypothetical protein
MEAIHTFEQLSQRLSQSSLALVPSNKHNERRRHKRKAKSSSSSVGNLKHARSKSAPQLSITPLGPATSDGWVRPKPGRKLSSDSKPSGTASPKRRAPAPKPFASPPQRLGLPAPQPQKPQVHSPPPVPRSTHPSQATAPSPHQRLLPLQSRPENRKSFMSFASDSTKLGEIPEHKWTRPGMYADGGYFPARTYYPLEPYQEPEKPRSRFMRLFKRS